MIVCEKERGLQKKRGGGGLILGTKTSRAYIIFHLQRKARGGPYSITKLNRRKKRNWKILSLRRGEGEYLLTDEQGGQKVL